MPLLAEQHGWHREVDDCTDDRTRLLRAGPRGGGDAGNASTLASSCMQLMSTCLKQDICGIKDPGVLVAGIKSSQVKKCLPLEVQYACLYWVQHLQRSSAQFCNQVYLFLQDHFLHWLEALSWIGKTSEGILAIFSLEALIPVSLLYNIGEIYD
jgi:hypothetical protein